MLLLLAEYLQQFHKGFAVFQYLTLRGILGVLTALSLSLFLGPWMIRTLQNLQIGQSVRNDGPQSHLSKSGTPTMARADSVVHRHQHLALGRPVQPLRLGGAAGDLVVRRHRLGR